MNYSDELKIVWLTPRRTATRTCSKFQQFFNFNRSGQHGGFLLNSKIDYTLILNIRSPYPRMVSLYHLYLSHFPKTKPVFDKWVEVITREGFNVVKEYEVFLNEIVENSIKIPDYYVRTEFLESDLKRIPFISDNINELSDVFENYVKRNESKNEFGINKPWEEYYTQELADLVYSRTEKQFKLFNYNKDYWKDGTP